MDTTIKTTIKNIDNLNLVLKEYFESDVRESLRTLFLTQGIDYEDIEFEFDYEDNIEGDYN